MKLYEIPQTEGKKVLKGPCPQCNDILKWHACGAGWLPIGLADHCIVQQNYSNMFQSHHSLSLHLIVPPKSSPLCKHCYTHYM